MCGKKKNFEQTLTCTFKLMHTHQVNWPKLQAFEGNCGYHKLGHIISNIITQTKNT